MNKKKVSEQDLKKYALFGLVSLLGLVFAINLLVNYVYAKPITIGTTADQVGIGTSTPAEKLTVAGNAVVSGNVKATSITIGTDTRYAWPTNEASVTPSPVYRTTLYGAGTGDIAFRTTANTPQSMRFVYGPFSYANSSITCPASYDKLYKIYVELVDNSTSPTQNSMLRLTFDNNPGDAIPGMDLSPDLNMGYTVGGAPSYRAWISDFITGAQVNTDHVTVKTWVSGTAGPYVEIRKVELLAYCIYIP